MTFYEKLLSGAYTIEIDPIRDNRGYFALSWSKPEFEERGLNANIVQSNVAFNEEKGTLRGMHFQSPPHAETKLIRCIRGSVYDVIIDLRPDSDTYKQWLGVELTARNNLMLYVPEGFAHGYQTLADDTELSYLTTALYAPLASGGVRYDDPAFRIDWPEAVTRISEKDKKWANYRD